MGGRYLISGTQLGMLFELNAVGRDTEVNKLLNQICNDQWVGKSETELQEDIKTIKMYPGD